MNTTIAIAGAGVLPAQPPASCGPLDVPCMFGSALNSMVTQLATGAADLVVGATTWWLTTPSVDPRDPAVLDAQDAIAPVVTAILMMSVLVAAARLIISRRAEPLVTLAATIGRFALVSALGLLILHGALLAGDALAADLLAGAATQFGDFMRAQLIANPENVLVSLLLSFVAAILAIIQWLLMELRQAGLLVLAAMLPLAATLSKAMLFRLLGWLIAIVVYKPAAAFIYFIGFAYLTSANATGQIATLVAGVMVLALAVFAMPVLMRFFSWTGTQISGSGSGSGFLGAAGAVAMSQSYQQSHAVNRSQAMEATGPGSQPTAAPTGSEPTGSAPTGAAAAGSAGPGAGSAGAGGSAAGGAGAAGGVAAVAGVAINAAARARDEMTTPPSTSAPGPDAPAGGSGRVASGSVAAQSPAPVRDQSVGGGRT